MTTSPLFKKPLRNGWFSMESAPRTGETIMLYESGRGVFEGWWKQTEYEAYWMDLQDSEPDPVAWRPILPGPHEVVAASPESPAEEVETLRAALTDALAFMKDVHDQRGGGALGILIRNAEAALGARAKGGG